MAHGGQDSPTPNAEERQRVLGITGPLQGAASSPILTWTKHSTAWGVEASPMGAGAVLGGHAHVVLESKTLHCLLVSIAAAEKSPWEAISFLFDCFKIIFMPLVVYYTNLSG